MSESDIAKVLVKVNEIKSEMLDCKKMLERLNHHDIALYGPPNAQEDGLLWRTSKNESDISMIKKVAFAIVPSTSVISAFIQWLLFLR